MIPAMIRKRGDTNEEARIDNPALRRTDRHVWL
jgi:hypothetical protein